MSSFIIISFQCHSLSGSVDWNFSAIQPYAVSASSLPEWECGLKYFRNAHHDRRLLFFPLIWTCGFVREARARLPRQTHSGFIEKNNIWIAVKEAASCSIFLRTSSACLARTSAASAGISKEISPLFISSRENPNDFKDIIWWSTIKSLSA